jgi:hypothetical protein
MFLPGQHPGAFGAFAMVPPQWLDPAYVAAYNWDYLRRGGGGPELAAAAAAAHAACKLPGVCPPPPTHPPFGKGKHLLPEAIYKKIYAIKTKILV